MSFKDQTLFLSVNFLTFILKTDLRVEDYLLELKILFNHAILLVLFNKIYLWIVVNVLHMIA